jgi:hypothetical protein
MSIFSARAFDDCGLDSPDHESEVSQLHIPGETSSDHARQRKELELECLSALIPFQ